jgi:hypothetical protein
MMDSAAKKAAMPLDISEQKKSPGLRQGILINSGAS